MRFWAQRGHDRRDPFSVNCPLPSASVRVPFLLDADRLRPQAKLLDTLNHPNILRPVEVGDADEAVVHFLNVVGKAIRLQ